MGDRPVARALHMLNSTNTDAYDSSSKISVLVWVKTVYTARGRGQSHVL